VKVFDNLLNSLSAPTRYMLMAMSLGLLVITIAVPDPLPGIDELLLIWLSYKTTKAALFGGGANASGSKSAIATANKVDYFKLIRRAAKLAKKVGRHLAKSEIFQEEAGQFGKVRANIKKTGATYKDIIDTLEEPEFNLLSVEREIDRFVEKKLSALGESEKSEIDKALALTEQRRDNIIIVIEAKGLAEARIERLFSQLSAIDAQLRRADLVARSSEAAVNKKAVGAVDLDRLTEEIGSLQSFFDEIEQPLQTSDKVKRAAALAMKND
jgi:hypothetical protein